MLISKIPDEVLIEDLLFLGYRGSVAHNMYVPHTNPNSVDDVDVMGVFLSPISYYIGMSQHKLDNPTTIEKMMELNGLLWDCVYYELRHFVGLLLKGNPNVLSMLWLKDQHVIKSSRQWEKLLSNRDMFAAKSVKHSFAGYASEQLTKMESFNKKGYMGEKRKALVEKFGYDTKNAAHLLRLLQMCYEFLKTGELEVFRDDAKTFLDVKMGKWSLNKVKYSAEALYKLVNERFETSTLPEEPNRERAERLVTRILYDHIVARWLNGQSLA